MKTTITVRVSEGDRQWLIEQAEKNGDAVADRVRTVIRAARTENETADRVIAEVRAATAAAVNQIIAELHSLARPRPSTSKQEAQHETR